LDVPDPVRSIVPALSKDPKRGAVPSTRMPTADVTPENVNVPPVFVMRNGVADVPESIVSSGAVPEVSLMPPAEPIASGVVRVLVFCAVFATLSTGAAAKACEERITAVAAESMRARLFKSNLL